MKGSLLSNPLNQFSLMYGSVLWWMVWGEGVALCWGGWFGGGGRGLLCVEVGSSELLHAKGIKLLLAGFNDFIDFTNLS